MAPNAPVQSRRPSHADAASCCCGGLRRAVPAEGVVALSAVSMAIGHGSPGRAVALQHATPAKSPRTHSWAGLPMLLTERPLVVLEVMPTGGRRPRWQAPSFGQTDRRARRGVSWKGSASAPGMKMEDGLAVVGQGGKKGSGSRSWASSRGCPDRRCLWKTSVNGTDLGGGGPTTLFAPDFCALTIPRAVEAQM